MRVAIFADIHGKLLLPFKLADLYQQKTGKKIDLLLQCGDIGAYPTLATLDKATLKHAQKDRDELGFYDDFAQVNPAIKSFLDTLNLQMICVRGNHEDHDYLDRLEAQYPNEAAFPIDAYGRVWVCKTGLVQTYRTENQCLRFVCIGRIGDRKGRTDKRFIQDYERTALRNSQQANESYDILLTHDKDDSSQRGYGMAEIRQLLDTTLFAYHFHGHTGEPYASALDHNGITRTIKIKELEFGASGVLPPGCMVILEKHEESTFELTVVDSKLTNKLTKHNWKSH